VENLKKSILPIVAIIVIGVILLVALSQGQDGVLLSLGVTVIAGIAGYEVGKKKATPPQ